MILANEVPLEYYSDIHKNQFLYHEKPQENQTRKITWVAVLPDPSLYPMLVAARNIISCISIAAIDPLLLRLASVRFAAPVPQYYQI